MEFDVVIGNPPYQLEDGGHGASASAIYNLFIDAAIDLNPKYITMITPSRWMSRSARGIPPKWVDKMISDNRIKELHDFMDSEDCFSGVGIYGGVNYFLWDREYLGKCSFYQHIKGEDTKVNFDYLDSRNSGVVIRDLNALSIIDKVISEDGLYLEESYKNFSSIVSPSELFSGQGKLRGNWKGFDTEESETHPIKYYTKASINGSNIGWIRESDITRNKNVVNKHKVYIPAAGPSLPQVLYQPIYGPPNSACSGTYIIIGYNKDFTKDEVLSIISYMKTKFFRYLVSIRKNTQHGTRRVYQFVPLQDWSKPWTDEELYKKYGLSGDEIDYIEDNVKPM